MCREGVRVSISLPGSFCSNATQATIKTSVAINTNLTEKFVSIVSCVVDKTSNSKLTFELMVEKSSRRRVQYSNLLTNLGDAVAAGAGVNKTELTVGTAVTLAIDCKGIVGGPALSDACAVCGGDNSTCADCAGTPNGKSVQDKCKTCDAISANDCVKDCFGVWGGSAASDACNVCNGSNVCADCAGVANGKSTTDKCGNCDGNKTNDCVTDCKGIWGGGDADDQCGQCGGNGSACADCAGQPNGKRQLDRCGICDTDTSNDCKADCQGEWGGLAKVDVCGLCGGNGSSCAVKVDAASPNAVISLTLGSSGIGVGTDLSTTVTAMASAMGTTTSSISSSIKAVVTLNTDASILTGDMASLETFRASVSGSLGKLLGLDGRVEITSMVAGSLVVNFAVAVNTSTNVTIPDVDKVLENATITSAGKTLCEITDVQQPAVTFAISAVKLAESGTDLTKALPLLNTQISEGKIGGVSSTVSVFKSIAMKCAVGYYTDKDGACSRCAVDESGQAQEPNEAQDGCVKCTDRVTLKLLGWYSPIGAQCTLCPQGRAPNEKRTACVSCPDRFYSDGLGMLCEACAMGKEPSADHSHCVPCAKNKFSTSGQCEACPQGRYGVDSTAVDIKAPVKEGANSCDNCLAGRTGPAAGTGCGLCSVGYYSLTPTGDCNSCLDTLAMPDERQIKSLTMPSLRDSCPGGIPGVEAGICPMPGIWIHISDAARAGGVNATPELLPCEAAETCLVQENCSFDLSRRHLATVERKGLAPGAVCGEGNEGFMCSKCKDGYTKIAGDCIECPGFNYGSLAMSLFISLLSAFYLLHKSTGTAIISPAELRQIWVKVDHSEAPPNEKTRTGFGYLSLEKAITGEKSVMRLTGIKLTQDKVEKMVEEDLGEGNVHIDDFVRVHCASQPTSGFGIAIFFVQTFALLAKDASFFGFADALNLDAEQAIGACVTPLNYNGRFISKMIVTPIVMFLGVPLSIPAWNKMRSLGCLQKLFEKMNLPDKIKKVHWQRGLLNAFLYCFAPLTRESVQALVCVPTCTDENDPECKDVLAFDQGVVCFEGEHAATAVVAIVGLGLVALVIPLMLIKKVQHARNKRNQSLNLKISEVGKWFREIDVDGGGSLDQDEVKILLKRLGEGTSTQKFQKIWAELDNDNSGEVDEKEFCDWFRIQVERVPDTPYDVLFGAYQPWGYWWFMQVLWVKTAINMLFTFGYFGTFSWHLWVHLVLAASVCTMVLAKPHTNIMDSTIELFALVCLAAVTHVASLFKSGETWQTRYLVATVLLFFLPLVATIGMTIRMKKKTKAAQAVSSEVRESFKNFEIQADLMDEFVDASKLEQLTVTQLKALASERGIADRELVAVVDSEDHLKTTIVRMFLTLQEEQTAELEEASQSKAKLLKQKEAKADNAAKDAAKGGLFASLGLGTDDL